MALLRPDRYFTRVSLIDPQADLLDRGIRFVLLDMDNTLLPRDTHEVPSDILAWLADLSECGVGALILSNNWHESPFEWGRRLGLPVVAKACKPLPIAYGRALRTLGATRAETVCIGDQLMTDIWGGHFAGFASYLVDPLTTVDLKHTLVLRKLERKIISGMPPEK